MMGSPSLRCSEPSSPTKPPPSSLCLRLEDRTSTSLAHLPPASMPDREFVELVWENGGIAMRGTTPASRCVVSGRRSGGGQAAYRAPDQGDHVKNPFPGDFHLRVAARPSSIGVDSSARANANDDAVAPPDDDDDDDDGNRRCVAVDAASEHGDADHPGSSRNESLFIGKSSRPTKTCDDGRRWPFQSPTRHGRDSGRFAGSGLCPPDPHLSSSDTVAPRESNSLRKPRSTTNFSLFLRPAVVLRADDRRRTESPMRSPVHEDLPRADAKADKREAPSTEPAADFGRRSDLADDKAKPVFTDDGTSGKAFPDEQSQVLGGKSSSRRSRKSNDQCRDPPSTAAAEAADKTTAGERQPCDPEAAASSSLCSRVASNYLAGALKRTHEDSESIYPGEDEDDETEDGKRNAPIRSRTTVHSLSERRRRDRINKRMRSLQELLPNCDKVDKASVLDEVVEYLKTLQRQLQIMSSTGSPLFMSPMMLPTGAHMNQFPMGMGMRIGAGADCGAFQFPIPPVSGAAALPRSNGTGVPMFGVQPYPYMPFVPTLTPSIPAVDVSGAFAAVEHGESASPIWQ